MAHVGTITGSMTLDPSAYIAGLNQAAQQTMRFQQSVASSGAGMASMGAGAGRAATQLGGLNRSIYASMTAFYMLSTRISAALGVYEEYSNVLSRIGATADMSTSSILGLSEALRGLNRDMGGSRTDMMKGMYRAVQSGFTTPDQFMPIAESAMKLRTASGREINTVKSADAISVIRNSLGIKGGKESMITDMLLKGRDVGRFELNEMTSALGIPLTIYGNQFSSKIGSQETLRQVITLLATSTQAGLSPNRAATGVRRMVEKTLMLGNKPGGIGKNLHAGFAGLGYANPIDALNEGPMKYLENLLKLTGGGSSEGLTKMGFGAREFMVLASTLRGNMGSAREIHEKLSAGNISGTTDKYAERQKEEWWYTRDRIRSAYEDSQINFMEAILPTMKGFASTIETVNDLFQALSPAVKNIIALMTIGAGFNLMKNFFVRPGQGGGGAGGGTDHFALQSMKGLMPVIPNHLKSGEFRNVPEGYRANFEKGGLRVRNAKGQYGDPKGVSYYTGGKHMRPSIYGGTVGYSGPKVSKSSFNIPTAIGKGLIGGANAAQFMLGGDDYRNEYIKSSYDTKMIGAHNKYHDGSNIAIQRVRDTFVQNKLDGVKFNDKAAENYLVKTLNGLEKEFDKTARAATRSAMGMSKISGVLGTLGSIANMAAIGGIFALMSKFMEGFAATGGTKNVDGKTDYTDFGSSSDNSTGLWEHAQFGLKAAGAYTSAILRTPFSKLFFRDAETAERFGKAGDYGTAEKTKMMRKVGYVPDKDRPGQWAKSTMADAWKMTLDEKFSPGDVAKLYKAGLGEYSPEKLKEVHKWLASPAGGNRSGMLVNDEWLNRTTKDGEGTLNLGIDALGEALKALSELSKIVNETTTAFNGLRERVGLSNTQAFMGGVAQNSYAVTSFWEDAKKKGAESSNTAYDDAVRKGIKRSMLLPDSFFGGDYNLGNSSIGSASDLMQSKFLSDRRALMPKNPMGPDGIFFDQVMKNFKKTNPNADQQSYDDEKDWANNYWYKLYGTNSKSNKGSEELPSDAYLNQNVPFDIIIARQNYLDKKQPIPGDIAKKYDSIRSDARATWDKQVSFADSDKYNKEVNKHRIDDQSVALATKLIENFKELPTMGDDKLRNLVREVVGDKDNDFEELFMMNLRDFDVSKYVSLAKTGEHFETPVQKYSEAVAYGSDSGYNATLPYWAEQGSDKFEYVINNFPELIELLRKTQDNTEHTADAISSMAMSGSSSGDMLSPTD